MKQYIKSENLNTEGPVPISQTRNNRADNNISSNQKNTSNANPATDSDNSGRFNASQNHSQPQSTFKKIIDSMFHCSDSKKNEIASTFMENALMKSNQVVKSYFDDMPPIPSFETTFTYDNIPIFDYQASTPKATTLLVNLSRTINGEVFIHKVHFTNVRGRVMNSTSSFGSTNQFGTESTNNLTGNGNKNSIAVNECCQNNIANKNNYLYYRVLDTANIESKAVTHAGSSTGAKEETTVNTFIPSQMNVNSSNESKIGFSNKHDNDLLKITEQQFDGNKLKKYLPNVVLNNIFD